MFHGSGLLEKPRNELQVHVEGAAGLTEDEKQTSGQELLNNGETKWWNDSGKGGR